MTLSGWPVGGPENNYAVNVILCDVLIKLYLGCQFENIIVGAKIAT